MAVVIIFREDLDNKTVKQVDTTDGKKVGAPSAEIEVLDSFNKTSTDTHYYEGETKYLKHVESGAVWQVEIGKMKERAAPRNEELTPESTAIFFKSVEDNRWTFSLTSAISGKSLLVPTQEAGNYTDKTGIFAQYANAKEANAALANEKLTITTNEYFADTVEGKPKILATTFELPYPAIPYDESTPTMQLYAESYSGNVYLDSSREELTASEKVEKTYSYKFRDINGREYEGTKKSTSNRLSAKDFEPSLEWYLIEKAEYSVQPFTIEGFFFNKQVAPSKVEVQNLVDHL
nr:MAG TPA: hypothetical protein [Caudoviricetes sp.]